MLVGASVIAQPATDKISVTSGTVFTAATEVFMGGHWSEVGINSCGVYGANDPVPVGFHPTLPTTGLGFVADPGRNGWTTPGPSVTYDSLVSTRPSTYTYPNHCGDYFVPGSPVEGWGVQFNGTSYYNTDLACGTRNIPGQIIDTNRYIIPGTAGGDTILETIWQGTVAGMQVTQKTQIRDTALYIITRVWFKNTTATTMTDIFYARNVDPDNEQTWSGGSFTTDNTVIEQPVGRNCDAVVSAVGINYGCFLAYGARTPNARATTGSFSTTGGPVSNYYTGNGPLTGTRDTSISLPFGYRGDNAISIAFHFDSIAPGDSVEAAFVYVLKLDDLDEALSAVGSSLITANGDSITDDRIYSACPGDTVRLEILADSAYQWEWLDRFTGGPETYHYIELDTARGSIADVYPDTSHWYKYLGWGGPCDTIIDSIWVVVDPSVHTTAHSDMTICEGTSVPLWVEHGRTFAWSPSGTLVILDSTGSSVIATPSVTTTYSVTSVCGVDSVTITVVDTFPTVTLPDTAICLGEDAQLWAAGFAPGTSPFTFHWEPAADLSDPDIQNPTAIPGGTTNYIVEITSALGCTMYDTMQVATTLGTAPVIYLSADTNFVCPGTVINIDATIVQIACGAIPASSFACPGAPFFGRIGTATTTTTSPSPFPNTSDAKMQFIIRASEMAAAGFTQGTISDLWFDLSTTSGTAVENLEISMGCTNQEEYTTPYTYITGGMHQVVSMPSYTPGAIPPTMTNLFNWDGVSNVVVQICYNNASPRLADVPFYTTTAYTSTLWSTATTGSGCLLTTANGSTSRPNIYMVSCPLPADTFEITWVPGETFVDCDTCEDVSVQNGLYNDTTLTIRVFDGVCTGVERINLYVDTIMTLVMAPDTTICIGDTAQLSVDQEGYRPPVCLSDYTVANIPFAPVSSTDIATGSGYSTLTLSDDQVSTDQVIGFDFKFFCDVYNTLRVSSNGFLTFDPSTASGCCSGQLLPNAFAPNNLIAFAWDDLYPPGGGTIRKSTVGTAPNRIFVLEFTNIPLCCTTTPAVSTQVLLYETTNVIEIHTTNSVGLSPATMGIENIGGTAGYAVPGRNASAWSASIDAWRFTPLNVGGDTIASVLWMPNTNLSSDTISNPVAWPITTTNYVVQTTFNNGCVAFDSVLVTVSNPVATASAMPDSICAGDSSTLMVTSTDSIVTTMWTPNMYITDTTVVNPSVNPPGTMDYSVTVYNEYGCPASDMVNVAVRLDPMIRLRPDTTVCPGYTVTISAPAGLGSYLWSNGDTTSSITVGAGSYWLNYTAEGGCPWVTDTTSVYEHSVPPVFITGDTTVCDGSCITVAAPAGYVSYQWSNGATTRVTSYCASGVVSYTVTDVNGCVVTSPASMLTFVSNPIIGLPESATVCDYESITLDAANVGATYLWSPTGETTQTISPTTSGTYMVEVNFGGCISYDTTEVTFNASPLLDTNLSTLVTCCAIVPLHAGPDSVATYEWSPIPSSDHELIVSNSGVYSVTATSPAGCTATHTYDITIVCMDPVAEANPIEITAGDNTYLTVSINPTSPVTYYWMPGNYVTDSTTASTNTIYLDSTQTYIIEVTYGLPTSDSSVCREYDTITIIVIPPTLIAMPDGFTPNGDGLNDYFYPIYDPRMIISIDDFVIFNRWGGIVYSGTGMPGWDGKLGGVDQPVGTYVYYVTYTAPDPDNPSVTRTYTYNGSVELLR